MTAILFCLIVLQVIYYTVKKAVKRGFLDAIKDINIEINYGPQQDETIDELD